MGYTHYWRRPTNLPKTKFKAWSEDVAAIIAASGVPLAGPDGTGVPIVGPDRVSFNGVEGPDRDDSHETFAIEPVYAKAYDSQKPEAGKWFDFTKTAHKPYDVVVTACLIRFHHHFGKSVEVTSDGERSDWAPGVALCRNVFGEAEIPPGV